MTRVELKNPNRSVGVESSKEQNKVSWAGDWSPHVARSAFGSSVKSDVIRDETLLLDAEAMVSPLQ